MLAKKTIHWVITPFLLSIIFLITGIYTTKLLFIPGVLSLLIFGFFIWFFRDPERVPDKPNGIVAPADGKILPFREDNKIRIFMNLNDVHVNRAPLNGKVKKMDYRKGGYKPAYSKDADTNEQLTWKIDTEDGEIEVVQIAGAIVRRISPYKKIGDKIKRAEKIGIIRFGSRVDVSIPKNYNIIVKEKDKVYSGKTVLAEKKK